MRPDVLHSAPSLRRGPFLLLVALFLLIVPVSSRSAVNVDVLSPREGASFTHRLNLAYVTGDAWVDAPGRRPSDIVFLIDTSRSTADPSGADVNGNGQTGSNGVLLYTIDPGDSILAAEITSARTLLRSLDPAVTSVAVVRFAGPRGHLPDAVVEQPLTPRYDLVNAALSRILARDPDGGTNMAEGMRVAINELTGFQSQSRPRAGADRSIYLFTDGFPTLPEPVREFMSRRFGNERKDIELTVHQAETAGRLGIKVNAFAVGKEALSRPLATLDSARVSGGMFVPVVDPGKLPAVVEAVTANRVDRVTVRNTTTGEGARVVQLHQDGTFDSLVPVRAGPNLLEITATATDGSIVRRNISVNYQPATEKLLDITVEQSKNLDRLLDIRVTEDKSSAPSPNKDLFIQIELDRQKATERAEQQRSELGMGRKPNSQTPAPPGPGSRR